MALYLLPLLALAMGLWFWVWWTNRRQAAFKRLLDLADEMELVLNRTAERVRALQGVVGRMGVDFSADAQASLQAPADVLKAKKDLLQHRLWIAQHGASASHAELSTACAALERSRDRIVEQLAQLEQAGAALAEATQAAEEAARREPASLRRDL